MINTVIFDLDGVIIDSGPVMKLAFTQSYREIMQNDTVPPFDEFAKHSGDSLPNIFKKMGLPVDRMYQRFRELSIKNVDKIFLFEDVIDVIKKLRIRNIKTVIVTGKERDRTLQILKTMGIDDLFDLVIASTDISNPKPHPESMLKVLETLNSHPDETLSIGDATNDIKASQQAGIVAVAVTWGLCDRKNLESSNPDYIIDRAAEILNLVSTARKKGVWGK